MTDTETSEVIAHSSVFKQVVADEVGANIVEHGYADDPQGVIDIWYRPSPGVASEADALGSLMIRDRGQPFDSSTWRMPDLNDAAVRKRGRGLGLMMVDRILDEIVYLPGVALGNFCLIRIGPLQDKHTEE